MFPYSSFMGEGGMKENEVSYFFICTSYGCPQTAHHSNFQPHIQIFLALARNHLDIRRKCQLPLVLVFYFVCLFVCLWVNVWSKMLPRSETLASVT